MSGEPMNEDELKSSIFELRATIKEAAEHIRDGVANAVDPWRTMGRALGTLERPMPLLVTTLKLLDSQDEYVCSQSPHPGVEFYGYGGCAECGYVPPLTRCPSIGPSDQPCIGTTEPWHEVHADKIGSTWRDYAAKVPGVKHEKSDR